MNKALFLDRDGTIIYDKTYLSDPDLVEIIPGVPEALCKARDLGYLLFLFTNQSGINRGYFTLEDALAVNARMEELLGLPLPAFTETCIAPETPDEPHVYRKPSPRFIEEMIARHDLDPDNSYMIGDGKGDIMAGVNAGIRSVVVETGQDTPPGDMPEVKQHGIPVFPSVKEFVEWLASQRSEVRGRRSEER